jgi:DNA-binding XRE family transcriptional regulator
MMSALAANSYSSSLELAFKISVVFGVTSVEVFGCE